MHSLCLLCLFSRMARIERRMHSLLFQLPHLSLFNKLPSMRLQLLPAQQQLRLLRNQPCAGDLRNRNNELRRELPVMRGQLQRCNLLHLQPDWKSHQGKPKHRPLQSSLCQLQPVQCFHVHGLPPRLRPRARLMPPLPRYQLHQLLQQPRRL